MNAKYEAMKQRAAERDAAIMARRDELIQAGMHPGRAYLQAIAEQQRSQKEANNG